MNIIRRICFLFTLFISKCILLMTKIIPKVSGTTWPGGIAIIIMKSFLRGFRFKDTTKVVMITGSGGKTTTVGMVSQLIKSSGKTICTNTIGANMDRGIATAMIKASKKGGRIDADYVVLEVDERYLASIAKSLVPDIIIVTNILKDQSQRNGEPGLILGKIANAISDSTNLILNGDEPYTASLGYNRSNVSYYGVANQNSKEKVDNFFKVSTSCPVCGGGIKYDYDNLLYIGHFTCSQCDLMKDISVDYLTYNKEEDVIAFDNKQYKPQLRSKDFLYCYATLLAFAKVENFEVTQIQDSINEFTIPSGRVENMKFGQKTINYLRIKQETPVTLQSAIEIVANDEKDKIIVFDLSEIVDFNPHYTGMYYAYDCNFEEMINGNVDKYICMSQVVCYDTATRLILEGVSQDKITVLPTDNYDQLLAELNKYECNNIYLLTWMHSYHSCLASVNKYNEGDM